MGKKKLYYEVLPAEEESNADENKEKALEEVAPAITPTRDEYAELMEAAKRVKRVRFRVMPDYKGGISAVTMLLAALIIACGTIMSIAKNKAVIIGVAVVLGVAVIAAVVFRIFQSVKEKRVYYCYYQNTDDGVFCMSVVEDRAVVFAHGTAYVIDGEQFFSLDERGFLTYLDGECSGILSVLNAKREDVEVEEHGFLYVKNRVGGGHVVMLEDGNITEITSEQPIDTDEVDAKTGERKVKTKTFVKVDPTEDFEWEVPEFVRERLRFNGIDENSVIPSKNS